MVLLVYWSVNLGIPSEMTLFFCLVAILFAFDKSSLLMWSARNKETQMILLGQFPCITHAAGMCMTPTTLCQCSMLQPGLPLPATCISRTAGMAWVTFLLHLVVSRLSLTVRHILCLSAQEEAMGYMSLYYMLSRLWRKAKRRRRDSGCLSCPLDITIKYVGLKDFLSSVTLSLANPIKELIKLFATDL